MDVESAEQHVLGITRPHRNLWTLYVIRCVLAFPLAPILVPYLWFRFRTLRYRFDREGVSMGWGILFRREVNLTYSRIQDIHLSSGFIQRWLGLADIQVQTASGSAQAEMTIEGLLEHEVVRDFLYQRMRGLREPTRAAKTMEASGTPDAGAAARQDTEDATGLLLEILAEVRAAREALERSAR